MSFADGPGTEPGNILMHFVSVNEHVHAEPNPYLLS